MRGESLFEDACHSYFVQNLTKLTLHCFFLRRMYAFLDNTSLFYSCSFVDVVFTDLYLCISAMQRILTHFLFVSVCRR